MSATILHCLQVTVDAVVVLVPEAVVPVEVLVSVVVIRSQ
jgi:hypothetical protein